jgi:hypothetical protein
MIRVGHVAVSVFGHRIDGQVATDQVFFEGDVGAGMKDKAAIAMAAFAFGSASAYSSPVFG